MDNEQRATEEQLAYARLLDKGMKLGLAIITGTFLIYILQLLPTHIPLDDLPRYWGMPVDQYLAATGIEPGWSWLGRLHQGDFLNFIGIAVLSGVTILCYLRIIPMLLRKKDYIYVGIVVATTLVLALAASGILTGGAH